MASPPYLAASPPGPSPLALPRHRPSLALPGVPKSRKASLASNTSSAHPLRQTSFPPTDSLDAQHAAQEDKVLAYSPSAQGSLDEISDTEIQSAISGPVGDDGFTKKRKRSEKRARGRPPKQVGLRMGSASLANGEDERSSTVGRLVAGAPSVGTGDGDADAEDEDEEDEEAAGPGGGGRVPLYAGGELSAAEHNQQHERHHVFSEAVPQHHQARYDAFMRAKLRTADVRRLVNQTLSQSVPANVVLVVSAYTKMFAGMLVEGAREVQAEWEAVEEREGNVALKKLKQAYAKKDGLADENRSGEETQESADGEADEAHVKDEPTSPSQTQDIHANVPNGGIVDAGDQPQNGSNGAENGEHGDHNPNHQNSQNQEDRLYPGGAGGLSQHISEYDRGPLLPDHLREALRRYKKARRGGTVGFTGLSLEGRETAAPRMGGMRLFR